MKNSFLSLLEDEFILSMAVCDLTDLTLVLPTYERPLFLLRQIIYLSKWKVSVEIVDASINPLGPDIIKLIEELPHINYQHIRASYPERIFLACARIKTPYAMCLADDDFYLQSGLDSAIKELESDSDAVACMGQSLGLDHLKNGFYYFQYGSNLQNYSITDATPLSRISEGLKDYRSATSYAVFRTSVFLKVWDSRENMSCLEAVEYEHAIRTYLYGRLITTPSLYWLRSFETQPIASAIDGDRAVNFEKWHTDARFTSELQTFRLRMTGLFINDGSLNIEDANALYESLILLIIGKSHSPLIDIGIAGFAIELIKNFLKKIPLLKNIKHTFIWKRILPFVSYFGRKKIKGIDITSAETVNELGKILKFCKSFNAAESPVYAQQLSRVSHL
jgi:glycosyltransferase domain-containing protein